ncbi:TPA: hypothetical protein ACP60B_000020 [Escherichia coli]|nr:hypothetical protein [Escherichia coli]EHS5882514.1 hypothetical protein [Salmonella enterica]EFS3041141.1 hypothetical protein [Escherichia coli]EHV1283168.1 hypothetical protein [Salmonella enterica]EIA9475938.1 hypothetical protein [Escherichia coli]
MFPSFKNIFQIKMTALSVIFFIFPAACSVTDFSNKENIECNESLYPNTPFYISDSGLSGISSPFFLSGNPNDGLMFCEKANDTFHKLSLARDNKKDLFANYFKDVPNSHDIYNIVKVPENGPEWISIGISLFALVSSFVIPYVQHRKERKEAINEGYWVREVIMPKINGLAFDVVQSFKNSMALSEEEFLSVFSNTLLPKLGELRDSLYLFNSFPELNADIENLESICDSLEEEVSNHIDSPNEIRISDISMFHSKLIQKLILLHKKIG